ncbi:ABC transporter ATP-binding protein [Pseudoalteromonas piscicida]|uniref:ABC transporter ATP-binding protein n=1 Tax=Pseudoalteromonas piscicida TaxID=43662 RepID=A0AAQ2EWS0_PSEO7|nr:MULTISPECIES: ABC transporter ATP-binding protein [Pseudoalteromonas]KJY86270.1 ABC transporter ATP-binding protein [Pseudoalteromonas piscicida]TMN38138.1 ABC transporter ATP-binding protein [Pseudoalteromonas piscicida]TMN41764.1 ABC transporter ATP-binding protein [Pseudoalteromonas piscicida]TMN47645.1 ABC transporter ATP-binding protein [Pseudoalteromonas piscicida]TMN56144.1 ABC transporter ATP-binding protein [Pseudoalteromonas piscicida]
MTDCIIQLKNICKTYGEKEEQVTALKSIDLDIHKGDFISITGPSGGGKSTLLSLLGLLDMPTSGTYLIEQVDTAELNSEQLAELRNLHLGFVFQSFNLIDELSLRENVALPLTFRENPKMTTQEIASRVEEALTQVGLQNKMDKKPNQISGGQQQRVAIARAIACKPSVMLLDEPTGNLDSENSENVMNLLCELNRQGMTICMVTHEPQYAQYATRIVNILDGQISSTHSLETTRRVDAAEAAQV